MIVRVLPSLSTRFCKSCAERLSFVVRLGIAPKITLSQDRSIQIPVRCGRRGQQPGNFTESSTARMVVMESSRDPHDSWKVSPSQERTSSPVLQDCRGESTAVVRLFCFHRGMVRSERGFQVLLGQALARRIQEINSRQCHENVFR